MKPTVAHQSGSKTDGAAATAPVQFFTLQLYFSMKLDKVIHRKKCCWSDQETDGKASWSDRTWRKESDTMGCRERNSAIWEGEIQQYEREKFSNMRQKDKQLEEEGKKCYQRQQRWLESDFLKCLFVCWRLGSHYRQLHSPRHLRQWLINAKRWERSSWTVSRRRKEIQEENGCTHRKDGGCLLPFF